MKQMARFSYLFTFLLLLNFIFSTNLASASNNVTVNLSVTPSQSVVILPTTSNAKASLNLMLTPTGNPQTERDPIDLVFVFDKSGSMDFKVASNSSVKRIDSAKSAMTNALMFFDGQNTSDRFGFVPFSSNANTDVVSLTDSSGWGSSSYTNSKLQTIHNKTMGLSASGGTNYTEALDVASKLFDSSSKDKNIIFLTDGTPTFSFSDEKVYYKSYWGSSSGNDRVEYQSYTDLTYQFTETTKYWYKMGDYFYKNNTKYNMNTTYNPNGNATTYKNNFEKLVKQNDKKVVQSLSSSGIKLYTLGFGDSIDGDYLAELANLTGGSYKNAIGQDINEVLMNISEEVAAPKVDVEVKIDLSKYSNKIVVPENSGARKEGNHLFIKHTFSYENGTPAAVPINLPLEFKQEGVYTFDNITLTYKDLEGNTKTKVHDPVTITVMKNAPASLNGTLEVKGVTNSIDSLVKMSGDSNNQENDFTINYSLTPSAEVAPGVDGNLSQIVIRQELPEGVSLIGKTSNVTTNKVVENGRNVAYITYRDSLPYKNGVFTTNPLKGGITLETDWALNNVSIPNATVTYVDSDSGPGSATLTGISRSQSLTSKVRINESALVAYDGFANGVIQKVERLTGAVLDRTDATKAESFGLKKEPVKELSFVSEGTKIVGLESLYSKDTKGILYFQPQLQLSEQASGSILSNNDHTYDDVVAELSRLVPGNNVVYTYQHTKDGIPSVPEAFDPTTTKRLTEPGKYEVSVKATGGFGNGATVKQTIYIDQYVEEITVRPNPIELEIGDEESFTVSVLPANATNKQYEVKIKEQTRADGGNGTVAVLANNSTISGISEGTAVLEVRALDGSETVIEVPITVIDPFVSVQEILISPESISVNENETKGVTITVLPENATNKELDIKVIDPLLPLSLTPIASFEQASVSGNTVEGWINGKIRGEAKLVVQATDGSGTEKRIDITVIRPYYPLLSIKFKEPVITVYLDDQSINVDDYLIYNPSNATNKNLAEVISSEQDIMRVIYNEDENVWYLIPESLGYTKVSVTAEETLSNGDPIKDSATFQIIKGSSGGDPGDGNGDGGDSIEGRW
ncbi:vWA domain-containing protein [Bacillus coahuilensis]|uniref:vWA domain-containing protein n=1 Tax=Bacillus coahuilensis TaxID=408580 RepID=UPI0001850834|nr:vWA domain-containing protein [Bacillus coahuilensis]